MLKISTARDPYDEGFNVCRFKEIEFKEGLTILVGCNGIGKTTIIKDIKKFAEKNCYPYYYYDNQKDGGYSNTFQKAMWSNNLSFAATSFCSSEGENIELNIAQIASKLARFLAKGISPEEEKNRKMAKLWASFDDDEEDRAKKAKDRIAKMNKSKIRILLLDAVDSGYSIDNIIELKEKLFSALFEDAKKQNLQLFIIMSANSYELARNEQCFDIANGKYLTFKDYEDYRKYILETRKRKDKRYERLNAKRKEKE